MYKKQYNKRDHWSSGARDICQIKEIKGEAAKM